MSMIRRTISVPFCAGTCFTEEGYRRQDGNISASVLGACIQTFAVICLVLMYLSDGGTSSEIPKVVWGFITATQLIGLLATIMLACHVHHNRSTWGNYRGYKFGARKMFFLWLFGLAGVVQFGFIVAVNIYCFFTDNPNDESKTLDSLSLASNAVSMLFYAIQIGFISFFYKVKFESSKVVNYTMMLILTSTVLEYINAVLNDGLLDHSNPNITNIRWKCYKSSPFKKAFTGIYPYLLPAKIEFALLSSACFLKMWSTCNYGKNHRTPSEIRSSSASESEPLLQVNRFSYHSLSTDLRGASVLANGTNIPSSRPISLYVTLTVGTIITAPMLVIVCLALYVNPTGSDYNELYINSWEGLRVTTEAILFVVLIMTFHFLSTDSNIHVKAASFDCEEGILTLCACGTVGINCFGIYAGGMVDSELNTALTKTARFLIMECVLAIINIYLQTVLIIHANRVGPSFKRIQSCIKIENLFMLLHILNIAMWLLLTLTSKQLTLLTPVQKKFFNEDKWKVIAHIFVPLFLFYRFQSALDLHHLFRKFRTWKCLPIECKFICTCALIAWLFC